MTRLDLLPYLAIIIGVAMVFIALPWLVVVLA